MGGHRTVVTLILFCMLMACAHTGPNAVSSAVGSPQASPDIYRQVRDLLDRAGPQLDHSQLMAIYAAMSAAERPIAHAGELLADLVAKRNDHPRIDQMILIFTAKIIGESRFEIPRAENLFDAILDQPDRLTEWVLSFVADAIGRYPYDLAGGDRLMDRLEAGLAQVRTQADPSREMYGFHFLPPPQQALIKSYLDGIEDQRQREQERRRYYQLIRRNIPEDDIAASLAYLLAREHDGLGPPCPLKMRCLLRMKDQIPLP